MRAIKLPDDVDEVWQGPGVLNVGRLSVQRTNSRTNPEYRLTTIRNWATTTRVQALLEAMPE